MGSHTRKNPIYEAHWVEDMMIVKDGGKYYMFAEGKDDNAQLLVSDKWHQTGTRIGQYGHSLGRTANRYRPAPSARRPPGKKTTPWYLFYERNDQEASG